MRGRQHVHEKGTGEHQSSLKTLGKKREGEWTEMGMDLKWPNGPQV